VKFKLKSVISEPDSNTVWLHLVDGEFVWLEEKKGAKKFSYSMGKAVLKLYIKFESHFKNRKNDRYFLVPEEEELELPEFYWTT
jgi:hypothetical protein